jgi:hypothetical protein
MKKYLNLSVALLTRSTKALPEQSTIFRRSLLPLEPLLSSQLKSPNFRRICKLLWNPLYSCFSKINPIKPLKLFNYNPKI